MILKYLPNPEIIGTGNFCGCIEEWTTVLQGIRLCCAKRELRSRYFSDDLSDVMPSEMTLEQKEVLIFNIILVKFEAKPFTLIDEMKLIELLTRHKPFMEFIKHDKDLIIGEFLTESDIEIWIYNKNLLIYSKKKIFRVTILN